MTATAGSGWAELVTTALLGTERRLPPGSLAALGLASVAVDRSDPALTLLDLAALSTVHRRAGLRPAAAGRRLAPAPEDPRPALPPAARRRLATLLADRGGSGGRRDGTPNLAELLPQWLATANRHHYRAPAALLPALLDAARRRSEIRLDAVAFAGPRGRWLATVNPDWKFALGAGTGCPGAADREVDDGPDPAADQRLWAEGRFAERVRLLGRLRHGENPSGAVELLCSTWNKETAEDRLLFLDAMRDGLSAADEPFLEAALADRSKNVRAAAADLLSAVPGSALATRMAGRANGCVTLIPGSRRAWRRTARLAVAPPTECDTAMRRDGISAKPPAGRGERSWWLGQIVESTPLALWTMRFSLSPEEILALPVDHGWRVDLHAAWAGAAVRQRDTDWARAVLGATTAQSGWVLRMPKLLSVLPVAERAGWLASLIKSVGLRSEAFQMLLVCDAPWPEPLGEAVLDALEEAREDGGYPWSYSGVMGLAERCLAPAHADRISELSAAAQQAAKRSPGSVSYWSEAFSRLAGTLRLRAAMLAELAPEAP